VGTGSDAWHARDQSALHAYVWHTARRKSTVSLSSALTGNHHARLAACTGPGCAFGRSIFRALAELHLHLVPMVPSLAQAKLGHLGLAQREVHVPRRQAVRSRHS
jgi:hypothetical protein